MSTFVPEKIRLEDEETRLKKPARVILYNDDWHTFDDVIIQLMKATGCTVEQGFQHAWAIHHNGRDVVFQAEREKCEKVVQILRQIRLQAEVDWDD